MDGFRCAQERKTNLRLFGAGFFPRFFEAIFSRDIWELQRKFSDVSAPFLIFLQRDYTDTISSKLGFAPFWPHRSPFFFFYIFSFSLFFLFLSPFCFSFFSFPLFPIPSSSLRSCLKKSWFHIFVLAFSPTLLPPQKCIYPTTSCLLPHNMLSLPFYHPNFCEFFDVCDRKKSALPLLVCTT